MKVNKKITDKKYTLNLDPNETDHRSPFDPNKHVDSDFRLRSFVS
jgi:hypothetical protein